jgi:hypothetical protein
MSIRFAPLVLALALALPGVAAPRKKAPTDGLPTVDEVAIKVREVYKDLAGNSDALVRRTVVEGMLDLEDEDRAAAAEQALKESDWAIQSLALGRILKGEDKALKKFAKDAEALVVKLLESGEAEPRTRGQEALKAFFKDADQVRLLQGAAKNGTPEARSAARGLLLARGGKVAWAVIEGGLKEPAGEPEHKEAVAALEKFKDPEGLKWAEANLHDATFGTLARNFLVRFSDPKLAPKMEAGLKKAYEKSEGGDLFQQRLRIASVLARRGRADEVAKTLQAGLRLESAADRLAAWEGIVNLRDTVLLGKLQEKMAVNENPAEVDLSYAWLHTWARGNAEPKVIELLQGVARGDRRELRLRAMGILADIQHRPSVALFESAMSEGQTEVRLAAAKGLAAVAKPGDEKRLGDFLRKEPDAEVKEALVDALGRIGSAEIISPLQFVITAPQASLKRKAAEAVAATGKPEAATLMGLLKRDPDLDVRFLAWKTLLVLKPDNFAEFKAGAVGWLTASHVEALGADAKISLDVMEFLAISGSDEQRPFAVKALEARGPSAATRLLAIFEKSGANVDTAAAALAALARVRMAESLPTYANALKHGHGVVRAAAFDAVGRFANRGLLNDALGGLADKEPLARAAAARAAFQIAGRESPEPPPSQP